MRRLTGLALGVAASAGFYLLLIDLATLPELLAGVGIGLIAIPGLLAARARMPVGEAPWWSWITGFAAAARRMPVEIVLVSMAAFRQLAERRAERGTFELREVEPGNGADRGRREILGSLSPGEIVVGHEDDGRMVVHRLAGRAGGPA